MDKPQMATIKESFPTYLVKDVQDWMGTTWFAMSGEYGRNFKYVRPADNHAARQVSFESGGVTHSTRLSAVDLTIRDIYQWMQTLVK